MSGNKFNTAMAARLAKDKSHTLRRHAARAKLKATAALPETTVPKNIRHAKSHVATFREGDKHHQGWRPIRKGIDQWDNPVQPRIPV
jgi:hypothetical protein